MWQSGSAGILEDAPATYHQLLTTQEAAIRFPDRFLVSYMVAHAILVRRDVVRPHRVSLYEFERC